MNKNIYKKVWNTSRGCLVAVEETRKTRSKAASVLILAAPFLLALPLEETMAQIAELHGSYVAINSRKLSSATASFMYLLSPLPTVFNFEKYTSAHVTGDVKYYQDRNTWQISLLSASSDQTLGLIPGTNDAYNSSRIKAITFEDSVLLEGSAQKNNFGMLYFHQSYYSVDPTNFNYKKGLTIQRFQTMTGNEFVFVGTHGTNVNTTMAVGTAQSSADLVLKYGAEFRAVGHDQPDSSSWVQKFSNRIYGDMKLSDEAQYHNIYMVAPTKDHANANSKSTLTVKGTMHLTDAAKYIQSPIATQATVNTTVNNLVLRDGGYMTAAGTVTIGDASVGKNAFQVLNSLTFTNGTSRVGQSYDPQLQWASGVTPQIDIRNGGELVVNGKGWVDLSKASVYVASDSKGINVGSPNAALTLKSADVYRGINTKGLLTINGGTLHEGTESLVTFKTDLTEGGTLRLNNVIIEGGIRNYSERGINSLQATNSTLGPTGWIESRPLPSNTPTPGEGKVEATLTNLTIKGGNIVNYEWMKIVSPIISSTLSSTNKATIDNSGELILENIQQTTTNLLITGGDGTITIGAADNKTYANKTSSTFQNAGNTTVLANWTHSSDFNVNSGKTLTLNGPKQTISGSLNNAGKVTTSSSATVDTVTIGALSNSGTYRNKANAMNISSTTTVNNKEYGLWSADGSHFYADKGTVYVNKGNAKLANLTVSTGAAFKTNEENKALTLNDTLNNGTISSAFILSNEGVLTNNGTVKAKGVLVNKKTIEMNSGSVLSSEQSILNLGTLNFHKNGLLSATGLFENQQRINVDNDYIATINSEKFENFPTGTVTGGINATVTTFNNYGRFEGDLTIAATGKVTLENPYNHEKNISGKFTVTKAEKLINSGVIDAEVNISTNAFENKAGGVYTGSGTVFSLGDFNNYGSISGAFNLRSNQKITNTGTVTTSGAVQTNEIDFNEGVFTVTSGGTIEGQGGGTAFQLGFKESSTGDLIFGGDLADVYLLDHKGLGKVDITHGTIKITKWNTAAGTNIGKVNLKGGTLSVPHAEVTSFFTGANGENLGFSLVKNDTLFENQTADDIFFSRVAAKLGDESDLRRSKLSYGDSAGVLLVREATSLNSRDVDELTKAWEARYGKGTIQFSNYNGDWIADQDRLTVHVANRIAQKEMGEGAAFFYYEQLDGRKSLAQKENSIGAPSLVRVARSGTGTPEDRIRSSGFGFDAIYHASGLTLENGAQISLTGVTTPEGATAETKKNRYLVSSDTGGTGSLVTLGSGSTLNLGVNQVAGAANDARGSGTILRVDSEKDNAAIVSVVNGDYAIKTLSENKSLKIKVAPTAKAASLSLTQTFGARGTASIDVSANGTLYLDAGSAEEAVVLAETADTGDSSLRIAELNLDEGSLVSRSGVSAIYQLNGVEGKVANISVEADSESHKGVLQLIDISEGLNASMNVQGGAKLVFGTAESNFDLAATNSVINTTGTNAQIEVNKKTSVAKVNAQNAVYTQTADTLISAQDWFQNSTLNLEGGYIDSANIRQGDNVTVDGDLGNNVYNVGGTMSSILEPHEIGVRRDPSWKDNYTKLIAGTLGSHTTVNLSAGGLLTVENLDLTSGEANIHLHGGVLETSLWQFFEGFAPDDVLPLFKDQVIGAEDVNRYGTGGVEGPKLNNLAGVDGDSGWIVINDDYIFATALADIEEKIARYSGIGEKVKIEYSGLITGEFNVDEANRFMRTGEPTVKTHSVVFHQLDLANRLYAEDNSKKLWIGDASSSAPADEYRVNVEEGIGFRAVTLADSVTINDGKEFALVGYVNSTPEEGIVHGKDSERFTKANALLPDAENGLSVITVKGGSQLTFGNDHTDQRRIGWVDKVIIDDNSKFNALKGEYAIWEIDNRLSTFTVEDTAYVHSHGTTKESNGHWVVNGTLYFENEDPEAVATLKGTLDNYRLTDARDIATLSLGNVVNNYAGATLRFNHADALGTITNEAGQSTEDVITPEGVIEGVSLTLHAQEKANTTFNNSGRTTLTENLTVLDKTIFNNLGTFELAGQMLVTGDFIQGGNAIESGASVLIEQDGRYINQKAKVSKYSYLELEPSNGRETADPNYIEPAQLINHGTFEVTGAEGVLNRGQIQNTLDATGDGSSSSTIIVSNGSYVSEGGQLNNEHGALFKALGGQSTLSAYNVKPESPLNPKYVVSRINNQGTIETLGLVATQGSQIFNGADKGAVDSADFTATDISLTNSLFTNNATLHADSAEFVADDADPLFALGTSDRTVFRNYGVSEIGGALTLKDVWAANGKTDWYGNVSLEAASLEMLGKASKLTNYAAAQINSSGIYEGDAQILNGDASHLNASIVLGSLNNRPISDREGASSFENDNLTLKNFGSITINGPTEIHGGLLIENGFGTTTSAVNANASITGERFDFEKVGDESIAKFGNKGKVDFARSFIASGLDIENGRGVSSASFKAADLQLSDGSTFKNWALADFRNQYTSDSVSEFGIQLVDSSFENFGVSSTNKATVLGKKLVLEENSKFINQGLADFTQYTSSLAGFENGAVVVEDSKVLTGINETGTVSDWAEFKAESLDINNLENIGEVSFENQAQVAVNQSVVLRRAGLITGTKNRSGNTKAVFKGGSADLTESFFVNASDASFGTTQTVEGEEVFVGGDLVASHDSVIANGLNFNNGEIVKDSLLNGAAQLSAGNLEVDSSEFLNAAAAAFTGDITAHTGSTVTNGVGFKTTDEEETPKTLNGASTLSAKSLALDSSDFLNIGTATFEGDVSASDGSIISNEILTDTSRSVSPKIFGNALSLEGESSLYNNGKAKFSGDVTVADSEVSSTNKRYYERAEFSGSNMDITGDSLFTNKGLATFTGNISVTGNTAADVSAVLENRNQKDFAAAELSALGLTLNQEASLTNEGSAIFDGSVLVQNSSFVENTSVAGFDAAALTGHDLSLEGSSHFANTGSAVFAANETGATGAISAAGHSYITNETGSLRNTKGENIVSRLSGETLSLEDNSYLLNKSGVVDIQGEVTSEGGSYLKNLTLSGKNQGTFTASGLTIEDGTVENTGSMVFGRGTEGELDFGSITAANTNITSGTAEDATVEEGYSKDNRSVVLKTGELNLNSGSLSNYGTLDVYRAQLSETALTNLSTTGKTAQINFVEYFKVLDGQSTNSGTIEGSGKFVVGRDALGFGEESAKLINNAGSKILVGELETGKSSLVQSTGTTIVANTSAAIGGDFRLAAGSTLDTGNLTTDAADYWSGSDAYLLDLQDSKVWAQKANVASDLAIDESSIFTVGIRKPASSRSAMRTAAAQADDVNQAVFSGNVTNKGKIVSYVDVVQNGQINDADNLKGIVDLSNASGHSYTTDQGLYAQNVVGSGVTFNQVAGVDSVGHVKLDENGTWLTNSVINIQDGSMDSKDLGRNGLGNNTYNVGAPLTTKPAPTPSGYESGEDADGNVYTWGTVEPTWKNNQVVLSTNALSYKDGTVINVYTGGVFTVNSIDWDKRDTTGMSAADVAKLSFINLHGGAIETTLSQMFTGHEWKPVVGVDKDYEDFTKDPASIIINYDSFKAGVTNSLTVDTATDESYFVFTDNNVQISTAVSVVKLIEGQYTNSNVIFSGSNYESFNVDQVNELQGMLHEDGSDFEYRVVFTDTVLNNVSDEQNPHHTNKTLVIGTRDTVTPIAGKNVIKTADFGIGFKAIANAENVSIELPKGTSKKTSEFVLVGSTANTVFTDGSYQMDTSHVKGGISDSVLFSDATKLLVDSSDGGSVDVSAGNVFSLGSMYPSVSADTTIGWVQNVDLAGDSELRTKKGEFAAWNLSTAEGSKVTVGSGSVLHTNKITGAAGVENNGVLYVENSYNTEFAGKIDNLGKLDTRGEFDVATGVAGNNDFTLTGNLDITKPSGVVEKVYNLTNRTGHYSVHDWLNLEDGAKVLNENGTAFDGTKLVVGSDSVVDHKSGATANWGEAEVAGVFNNEGQTRIASAAVSGLFNNTGVLNGLTEDEDGNKQAATESMVVERAGRLFNGSSAEANFDRLTVEAHEGVPSGKEDYAVQNLNALRAATLELDAGLNNANKAVLTLGDGEHFIGSIDHPEAILDNSGKVIASGTITQYGTLNNNASARVEGDAALTVKGEGFVDNKSFAEFDSVALEGGEAGFDNLSAVGPTGKVISKAELRTHNLTVNGTMRNDGDVVVEPAAADPENPTVVPESKFELSGGSIENSGLFDVHAASNAMSGEEIISSGESTTSFTNKGKGRLLASDMQQNGGDVFNQDEASVSANSWSMDGGLFSNTADNAALDRNGKVTKYDVTLAEDFTQKDATVINEGSLKARSYATEGDTGSLTTSKRVHLDEDFIHNAGQVDNSGEILARNLTMDANALELNNNGAASRIVLSGNFTQSSGLITNEGGISAGDYTSDKNSEGLTNSGAGSFVNLQGNVSQSSGLVKNDGSIKVGFDDKDKPIADKGNWLIGQNAEGLTNTNTNSKVAVANNIEQSAALVSNKGSISANDWTVLSKDDTANAVQGIENLGAASKIDLAGSLDQSAGNFLNEGAVRIAGNWTESGTVRTIDNLKDATVENPTAPTITVGGNIRQEHGFVTNEGKIEAGFDKSGSAVADNGNWTIDGITMGLKNQGADSEIKLAGDLTQLFGHVENEGMVSADDYTIGYNPDRVFGDVEGAGASGLTNKGTIALRGSLNETSGFASNEGTITVGFDKDGNPIAGKGNWTIDEKSVGFENKGAASSIKLAGNLTQTVGDAANEGSIIANDYTMSGIAHGLDNKATVNEDGIQNIPSVTLTGSITQSSGTVNNDGRISAGFNKDGTAIDGKGDWSFSGTAGGLNNTGSDSSVTLAGNISQGSGMVSNKGSISAGFDKGGSAIAGKGSWDFSGTAEGLENVGADSSVTLAGNITQSSGFVSNDGSITAGFDKSGAVAGSGNWNITGPSATGFSNKLETSEIKLAGSITQEVGDATNRGSISAHNWTVKGSASGIDNLGQNAKVELTGSLDQQSGNIVNEGTMIGVDESGKYGSDNAYSVNGNNTNTGVFVFNGKMTQNSGDITNNYAAVEENKEPLKDNGTFIVGEIEKIAGSIVNNAKFIANGDVSQASGSIESTDTFEVHGSLDNAGTVDNAGENASFTIDGNVTQSAGRISNDHGRMSMKDITVTAGDVLNTGSDAKFTAEDLTASANPTEDGSEPESIVVRNEGTMDLNSATFGLGSELNNTGRINFNESVVFKDEKSFQNNGELLAAANPESTVRSSISIADGIDFATAGDVKADKLIVGEAVQYHAGENTENTFQTADFGKANTRLDIGSGAKFTVNGKEAGDTFALKASSVANNRGEISLSNLANAYNEGYIDNTNGSIVLHTGTKFVNSGATVNPENPADPIKLGGIHGGVVTIEGGAHLYNSGDLQLATLGTLNSTGPIYDADGKISDENDQSRAHFHQVGSNFKVTDYGLNNTNIYIEQGAAIDARADSDAEYGRITSLGENNLYILRSGLTSIDIWDPEGKGDRRLVDEANYLKEENNKYVRFRADEVALGGSNVFKLEEGGTLIASSLPTGKREDGNPTIYLAGGALQTTTSELFKHYPYYQIGSVKDDVKTSINLASGSGYLIFEDPHYTLDMVKRTAQSIRKAGDTDKSISIAFLGELGERNEFLVSEAHDLTDGLDPEDRLPAYVLFAPTLANDRLYKYTTAGEEGSKVEAIRIGNIGEADNFSIQEAILVKNVGQATTTEIKEPVFAISIEDGRHFGLGGYKTAENKIKTTDEDGNEVEVDSAYNDHINSLFLTDREKGGLVHVKDGKFSLGGLSYIDANGNKVVETLAQAYEDEGNYSAKGWIGSVIVEDKGSMDVWKGQWAIDNLTNKGVLNVQAQADLHLTNYNDEGSGAGKGLWNAGGVVNFEQQTDTLVINGELHNGVDDGEDVTRGLVKVADGVNTLEVKGLVKDYGGFLNKDQNANLTNTVIDEGAVVVSYAEHDQENLTVGKGGSYLLRTASDGKSGSASWENITLDGTLDIGKGSALTIKESSEGKSSGFSGEGNIINAGELDLTNAGNAKIAFIYNLGSDHPQTEGAEHFDGLVKFDKLEITARSTDLAEGEKDYSLDNQISVNQQNGEVRGSELTLGASHRFDNFGAINVGTLNQSAVSVAVDEEGNETTTDLGSRINNVGSVVVTNFNQGEGASLVNGTEETAESASLTSETFNQGRKATAVNVGTINTKVFEQGESAELKNFNKLEVAESLNQGEKAIFTNLGSFNAQSVTQGSLASISNSGSFKTHGLNQGTDSAFTNTGLTTVADLVQNAGASITNTTAMAITNSYEQHEKASLVNELGATVRFGKEASSVTVDGTIVPEDLNFVLSGDIHNRGMIDARTVSTVTVGNGQDVNTFITYNNDGKGAKAEAHFYDLVVNGKGHVINEGVHTGHYLTVNKDALYTVTNTGNSTWTEVFLIEGKLDVEEGGVLRVLVDEKNQPETQARSPNNSISQNAHVVGQLSNRGTALFEHLYLDSASNSHNYNIMQGRHLTQLKGASHSTHEGSDSLWNVVDLYDEFTNEGNFVVTENLNSQGLFHNKETGTLDVQASETTLTNKFLNEGEAKFKDLVLVRSEPEAALLDASSEESLPADLLVSGSDPENMEFVNYGAGSKVSTDRFEINAGYDVVVAGTAENEHKDLVLRGGNLAVLNGSKLNVLNTATLSGGTFLVGNDETRTLADDSASTVDSPLTSVDLNIVDGNVGTAVSIISGGQLAIGPDAALDAEGARDHFRSNASRLIISNPVTLTSTGSFAVGSGTTAEAGSANFGSDSQFVVNFSKIDPESREVAAITGTSSGTLTVNPSAQLLVNLENVRVGKYYVTKSFNNSPSMSGNSWSGGWKEQMVRFPDNAVVLWDAEFGYDVNNTWINVSQVKDPNGDPEYKVPVTTPDLIEDLINNEPGGPASEIAKNLLSGGSDPATAEERAKAWNSLVNLGFSGAQMATAYSTLTNAADAVQNRGSMIAEGFNKDGWRAHKTRSGDAWIQVLGSRDRVKRYDASNIRGGFESKSTGFVGGIARNLESANATIGAAISYQRGQAKSKEGVTHTENRFYTFGAEVYGNWSPNPLINIVGDAGYYYNEGKVDQRLISASGFRKADARIHTNMYTVGARAESTLKVGQASVIPHVGVRWIHGKTTKYNTKLDGQTAFNSAPKATDTWQFPIGISLRGDITTKSGWKIRPTADVSVVLQAGDRRQSVIFGSPEVPSTSTVYGRFTGNQIYMGQLGVQIEKGTVTYGIRYGYSTGGYGKSDHEIKLEAIWRF